MVSPQQLGFTCWQLLRCFFGLSDEGKEFTPKGSASESPQCLQTRSTIHKPHIFNVKRFDIQYFKSNTASEISLSSFKNSSYIRILNFR